MEHIRVTSKGSISKVIFLVLILVVVFIAAIKFVDLDMAKFFDRLKNVPHVLKLMLAVDPSVVPDALLNIVTTLALAFLGLVVAIILALILSFLAASNIAPSRSLAIFIKGFFSVMRSVPALVWGLMVISSLGFGNISGFVVILIVATSYLTKTFTGSIEEVGGDVIEAMKSTGASWSKIVYHGLLPLCITAFVSWMTIGFETSVAEAIGLGIIGVGGIGLLLSQAISSFNYAQLTTFVIMICLLMIILELFMTRIKNRIKFGKR